MKTSRYLGAFLVLVAGSSVIAAEWESLKSEDGQFIAVFPKPPQATTVEASVGPMPLFVHAYASTSDAGCRFSLLWNDYPGTMMAQTTPERVFEGIVKGYEVPGRKVLSDKPITIAGMSGRELEVDLQNGEIHRVRLLMKGRRLYQLLTYAPVAARNHADITKFIDGFAHWPIRDFPASGFSLEGAHLDGWVVAMPDKSKTVVQWLGPGSTVEKLASRIIIDVGKATDTTAEAAAEGLAKSWGGQVVPQRIAVDGELAFRVEAPPKPGVLAPVEGVVFMRQGYLYLIIGGVIPGQSCRAQIEEITKAWKWQELVDASKHLDFMPDPILAFDGTILINYPKDMVANPGTNAQVTDLSLHDLKKNIGAFQAYLQLLPIPKDMDFPGLKDAFLVRMNSEKVHDDQLEWQPRNGEANRLVTPASRSASASEMVKGEVWIKWALIQIDAQRMVLINFTIAGSDREERSRYEAAAEKIVDSIRTRTGAPVPKL